MSWDHLSSKALLHVAPDMVLVWNEVQRHEAVEMHGLPGRAHRRHRRAVLRPVVHRTPARGPREFCRAMGLRADRPFVLWVHRR